MHGTFSLGVGFVDATAFPTGVMVEDSRFSEKKHNVNIDHFYIVFFKNLLLIVIPPLMVSCMDPVVVVVEVEVFIVLVVVVDPVDITD